VTRRRSAGFSLVEVVVALGLLAGVLISISGLFVLANRQLDGGRNHSMALAVARDILEEMDGWSFAQLYSGLGSDGSSATLAVDSRVAGPASKWQEQLAEELIDCRAEILLESIVDSGMPPALRDAQAIRVQVTVYWKEGLRERSARLTAVRV
jgi:Tfp pilus assembly protein PilV